MPINQIQADNLKKHEGFRAKTYHCTAGKLTIGYGYNLDANPLHLSANELQSLKTVGITEEKADHLLKLCCTQVEEKLIKALPWFIKLDNNTQYVLINMAFNLGVQGLLAFKNTLKLIQEGKTTQASIEMMDSKWAKQVKSRAIDLALILKSGKIR